MGRLRGYLQEARLSIGPRAFIALVKKIRKIGFHYFRILIQKVTSHSNVFMIDVILKALPHGATPMGPWALAHWGSMGPRALIFSLV